MLGGLVVLCESPNMYVAVGYKALARRSVVWIVCLMGGNSKITMVLFINEVRLVPQLGLDSQSVIFYC